MQQAHLNALELKHASIDRQIMSESQRPLPNGSLLAELKRRKLRVKEEIAGL